MTAIDTVTAAATANGWEATPDDLSKDMTYRKDGMVFKVPAYPSGAVACGILDHPDGRRGLIEGKDKAARVIGFLKEYGQAVPAPKINRQKVRDHAEMIARSLEECMAEDATQYTDYAAIQAMIAACRGA